METEEVTLDWRFSGALPTLVRITLGELKRFHDETKKHFAAEAAKLEKRAASISAETDDEADYLSDTHDKLEGLLGLMQEFAVIGLYRTLERFLRIALIHLHETGASVSVKSIRYLNEMAIQFKRIGVDLQKPPFDWSEIIKLRTIRNLIVHDEGWVDKKCKRKLAAMGLTVNENDWLKLPDEYFPYAWNLVHRTCQLVVKQCLEAQAIGKISEAKPREKF